jgi:murein L,D-transpeptidase YcbB/YkuD
MLGAAGAQTAPPVPEPAAAPVPATPAVTVPGQAEAPAVSEPVAAPAPAPPPVQPVGPLAEAIAARLAAGLATLDVHRQPDLARLRQFYEGRSYAAAWFADTGAGLTLLPAAQSLRQVTAGADADGLLPSDYHSAAIAARVEATDPARQAELDVLLTDALMDYAGDVHHGRVPPHSIAEEFALVPPAIDVAATATAALAASDLPSFLAGLAPNRPGYLGLKRALRTLRAIEAAGGWPRLSEDFELSPGAGNAAVRVLRRRLAVTGDLDAKLPVTPLYDQAVKAAVQRFQRRHGLEPDGVVRESTRAALNVGVAERIVSVIANMERERWMPDDLGPRRVLVNVPGFNLRAVADGKVVLEMPVIVGTRVRRTPIFGSQITSLIWNPTWSVPTKLAREDILPKLRRDPNYLAEQHIALYDGSFSGGRVNPARIDWETFRDINRFRLRQMPGAHNALGQVKFNIPNDFDVYLHDTPHREKFGKAVRTFSSGCVRVGNPMALADFVLADMPEWTEERRSQVLKKGETRLVTLRTPVPVYLLYQTAWVDDQGLIQFREDIYGRDAQVIQAIRRNAESVTRSIGTAG